MARTIIRSALPAVLLSAAPRVVPEYMLFTYLSDSARPRPVSVTPSDLDYLNATYTALAENYGKRTSNSGYTSFIEAINQISITQAEACGGSSRLTTADAHVLIREFMSEFNRGSKYRDLNKLRSTYGKLLCINSTTPSPTRSKRQSDSSLCRPSEPCGCPPGGLNCDLLEPCEFFSCLDPDDHLKPILGFDGKDLYCLAFIIDTTGSMGSEIGAAKRIVREFIAAENFGDDIGCYMLVPFNDVGPDGAHVPHPSK